jgi:hypothetical protein
VAIAILSNEQVPRRLNRYIVDTNALGWNDVAGLVALNEIAMQDDDTLTVVCDDMCLVADLDRWDQLIAQVLPRALAGHDICVKVSPRS